MSIALLCLLFNELLDGELRSALGKCVNPFIWLICYHVVGLYIIKIAKAILVPLCCDDDTTYLYLDLICD